MEANRAMQVVPKTPAFVIDFYPLNEEVFIAPLLCGKRESVKSMKRKL